MNIYRHLFILLILCTLSLKAQFQQEAYYQHGPVKYQNHVYQPGIRTVQLYPNGKPRAFPIVKLRSGGQLTFSFDDLYEEYVDYSYTIIHCNADWQPSSLLKTQYLSGFDNDYIRDYTYSVNALIPYTHYRLRIPNSEVSFTKSGNYILMVYRDGNRDKPVITRRFYVYEQRVQIGATVKRPSAVKLIDTHQEIDFTVNHSDYTIQNPERDLQVILMQNQRPDNAIRDLKPRFIQSNRLVYQYDEENTFPGTNEFRFFDLKNLQTLSQNVRNVERDSLYKVYLRKEFPRAGEQYSTWPDINGQYVIRRLDAAQSATTADYARVDFYLDYPAGPLNRKVYVFGDLTDWKLRPEFEMRYDAGRQAYRLQSYLKQGYYNYFFALANPRPEDGADVKTIEGSHWETENTYQILVYNREVGSRYDKLIGFSSFSSEGIYR